MNYQEAYKIISQLAFEFNKRLEYIDSINKKHNRQNSDSHFYREAERNLQIVNLLEDILEELEKCSSGKDFSHI